MVDGQTPLRTEGLGKKYRRGWALRDCTLSIPPNRLVALVGPNGAGKSTLMGLVTGLVRPTAGTLSVFGDAPGNGGPHPGVAYLAQAKPLYTQFTVAETLRLGQRTNPTWDQAYAEGLIQRAQVPMTAKVGTLSGGQRTRVALALALGKRPSLLLLDEPLADLDPLARETVLRTLVQESREQGITVVLSSHVLTELEGVCDHLVLLSAGKVRLSGDVDDLLDRHVLLVGPPDGRPPVPAGSVIDIDRTPGSQHVLAPASLANGAPGWQPYRPSLGHLTLGYMRASAPPFRAEVKAPAGRAAEARAVS